MILVSNREIWMTLKGRSHKFARLGNAHRDISGSLSMSNLFFEALENWMDFEATMRAVAYITLVCKLNSTSTVSETWRTF